MYFLVSISFIKLFHLVISLFRLRLTNPGLTHICSALSQRVSEQNDGLKDEQFEQKPGVHHVSSEELLNVQWFAVQKSLQTFVTAKGHASA